MKDIKSMTLAELTEEFTALGEPKFRAGQVYTWLHRGARSFDEMTNLSKPLREKLAQNYALPSPTVARRLESKKDGTIKYLWRLTDGNCVESVLKYIADTIGMNGIFDIFKCSRVILMNTYLMH